MRALFPTHLTAPLPRCVQLAGANACVFFSDPRKAQFGHERSRQQTNRQRLIFGIRGVQVHGKSIPTHRFSPSAKTAGGVDG